MSVRCKCGTKFEPMCPKCQGALEWISVKDRFPKTQESVLVFCGKSMRVAQRVKRKWYLSGSYHEFDYGYDIGSDWDYECTPIGNVTHWSELPKPPEKL